MSYSGRCLLSNFITGRPANRGACAQLCRWKYDVILRERESGIEMPIEEDNRGAYIMNAKDLCLMPRLREVIESGPDSLKIEGRNRSEYYVGSVVHAYRSALDAYKENPDSFNPEPFMKDLEKLESRGYTTAFFDGNLGPGAHNYETTRSDSVYHAAGVITKVDEKNITLELRNEIKEIRKAERKERQAERLAEFQAEQEARKEQWAQIQAERAIKRAERTARNRIKRAERQAKFEEAQALRQAQAAEQRAINAEIRAIRQEAQKEIRRIRLETRKDVLEYKLEQIA